MPRLGAALVPRHRKLSELKAWKVAQGGERIGHFRDDTSLWRAYQAGVARYGLMMRDTVGWQTLSRRAMLAPDTGHCYVTAAHVSSPIGTPTLLALGTKRSSTIRRAAL
jgi:hypothetical protein